MQGRISVVISSYNRPDLLRKSLLSLSWQTVLPYEVIITDDGSSINIPDRLQDILDKLNFKLKYIWHPDEGFCLSKARNNAIREVKGEYVVFMDQDIIHTRGYIAAYAENMKMGEFLTAYILYLSQTQSEIISEENILNGQFLDIINDSQIKKMRSLYYKDLFYYYQRKLVLRNDHRPKVRGGYFGVPLKHILDINGFDENYVGWGAEDDDFGRRLYKHGVIGRNVFKNDFPIHLYHVVNHDGSGKSVNLDYYNKRIPEIKAGDIRAVKGLEESKPDEALKIIKLK